MKPRILESSYSELVEIVDALRHPTRYQAVGASIPHGVAAVARASMPRQTAKPSTISQRARARRQITRE